MITNLDKARFEYAKRIMEEDVYEFANKMEPVFEVLGLEWAGDGVPDRIKIANTLLSLIDEMELIELDCGTQMAGVGTGRLEVFYEYRKNDKQELDVDYGMKLELEHVHYEFNEEEKDIKI